MANEEHVKILKQGVEAWNKWREENPQITPDLDEADFEESNLKGINLHGASLRKAFLYKIDLFGADLSKADFNNAIMENSHLSKANLREANLSETDLQTSTISQAVLDFTDLSRAELQEVCFNGSSLIEANLEEADLSGASFIEANLNKANLRDADLRETNLRNADLSYADLTGAILGYASLVDSYVEQAVFDDCQIYGISVWNLIGTPRLQSNLAITFDLEITVDSLEVAQFINLLLYNEKIRHVIDTITSKVVLILGRFTDERKSVLDAIRDELRKRDYLPVVFDFDKPASRDLTETISTLAHMARFIIADITDAKSIPQELQAVVPNLPSVPIQPLLLGSSTEYGMFEHFRRYPWVLEICRYHDPEELIQSIQTKVIAPAEEKAEAFMEGKNK